MTKNFYRTIDFPFHTSDNGTLLALQNSSFQKKDSLPFNIAKVLIIKDVKNKDIRGGHTHHKTRQIIFVISGSCTVSLDNGSEKDRVVLEPFNRGLVLEPYVWHTMEDFKPNTVLLVLADQEYDEKDYIRNYADFLTCLK